MIWWWKECGGKMNVHDEDEFIRRRLFELRAKFHLTPFHILQMKFALS